MLSYTGPKRSCYYYPNSPNAEFGPIDIVCDPLTEFFGPFGWLLRTAYLAQIPFSTKS